MKTRSMSDNHNLRTTGKIKELSYYPGRYSSLCHQKKWQKDHNYTPYNDDNFPYITWKIKAEVDQHTDWQEVEEQYGEISNDWSEYKLKDDRNLYYRSRDYADGVFYHPPTNLNNFDTYYRYGASKQVARLLEHDQVMQNLKWLREWCKGDRFHLYVNVTAYVNNTEVGEDSLGGIESTNYPYGEDPYVQEVVSDMKHEIVHSLPDTIKAKLFDLQLQTESLVRISNLLVN